MKPIPKALKNRINQASHRLGQQYAVVIRDSLMKELQRMTDENRSPEEMSLALTVMERSMLASASSSSKI